MSKPIVAVIGATGSQGGSVLEALVASGKYSVRAATRNTSSDRAKKIAAQPNVEVVQADIAKKEDLERLFNGADYVFGFTNFFDPAIYPKNIPEEERQGKQMIDVAKASGVKYFVWSSLPDATKISKGKHNRVFHFDGKAHVAEYALHSGLPCAIIEPGVFMENYLSWPPHKQDDTRVLSLPLTPPDTKREYISIASDFGRAVVAMMDNPQKWKGRTVRMSSDLLSQNDVAAILQKVTGKPYKYVEAPAEYANEELGAMYKYFNDHGVYGRKPDEAVPFPEAKELGIKLTSFEEWVKKMSPSFSKP
ncbi:hypothetical protein BZG36_00339 [Bifiguratus adelaidae]|uniref:NmrA-like domain-containing protein n=1 Tax=Bifiguratus adelaidae TaxID=1938954 RepID=A0A261Y7Q3_9FUNG|nr:hypothetical protein BZG36_00339 [Bifiguratus adelaidae]